MDSILDTDITSMGTLTTAATGRFTVHISANELTTTDTQLPTDFITMNGTTMVLASVITVLISAVTMENFFVIAGFTTDIPTIWTASVLITSCTLTEELTMSGHKEAMDGPGCNGHPVVNWNRSYRGM